ncbi:hypothetical protein FOA43_002963 [Brettanomyces nanus]|uniref:Charged multivesicular body protein 3 n=1 Tax=Eeniella nana TaxID=13502 RepID=A0A875S2N6_EENNA|nr:uncharacterized protein FOA43_002963 [Brettanomyces nanus]QPG75606.1 hypothetical protein FOA43_002963 [Brettanomyces nanus]
MIRRNKRQMDRQIQDLSKLENKTKSLIKGAVKKGDMKSAKMYAREYRNVGKTVKRMSISRATLDSIGMKLGEQQQLIKIKGSMQKSTAIMKDMNTLVKLPQMSRTVQQLSRELTKSGVIDEMVDDMIDENSYEEEDEDEEKEIDQILDQVLSEQESKSPINSLPEAQKVEREEAEEPEEPVEDEILENMRERLSALE